MRRPRNPDQLSSVQAKQDKFNLIISELYVTTEDWYIEFHRSAFKDHRSRRPAKPLKFYRLLVITDDPPRIIVIADLGHDHLGFKSDFEFYVLGYSASTKKFYSSDHSIALQAVPFPEKFRFTDDATYTFLLVFSHELDTLRKIRLFRSPGGQSFESRELEYDGAQIDAVIAPLVIDSFSTCIRPPCKPLSTKMLTFFKQIEQKNHVKLPEKATPQVPLRSLNICNLKFESFTSLQAREGHLTPGERNDCSGMTSIDCGGEDSENMRTGDKGTTLSHSASTYSKLFSCTSATNSPPTVSLPNKAFKKKTRLVTRPMQRKIIHEFYRNLGNHDLSCLEHLPKNANILERQWISSWLRFRRKDNACVLVCEACNLFYQLGFRKDIKHKKAIATPDGAKCRSSPSDNLKVVLDHLEDNVHQMAVTFRSQIDKVNIDNAIEEYEKAEYVFLEPTIRFVTLGYAELKAGSSFSGHHVFTQALRSLGIDLGTHHYHVKSASHLAKTLSDAFHHALLDSLVEKNRGFSFLIDGSTDSKNHHLVATLIQTIENGKPMVYFYSLIHLDSGESAIRMFESVRRQIELDDKRVPGFEEYFRTKIKAVVSDNASVMVAKTNSFFAHMKSYAKFNIISIGCMAHKLQLSIQRGISSIADPKFKYFQDFDQTSNDFYTFYMSRGSKRYQHLKTTSEAFELPLVRLKKMHEIRWAASHYEVVHALVQDFKVLANDLENLKEDKTMSISTRKQAGNLFETITDIKFALVLREFHDVLSIFKKISLALQSTGTILVDKHSIIQEGVDQFKLRFVEVGPELKSFIDSCTCSDICEAGACDLHTIESCQMLTCDGVKLRVSLNEPFKLSDIRKQLYQSFVTQLESYFSLDVLDSLSVFDIKEYINANVMTVSALKNRTLKFKILCDYLSVSRDSCDTIEKEYVNILQLQFGELPNADHTLYQSSSGYLTHLLQAPKMSKELVDTIEAVLVMPFGSSACERVFSIAFRSMSLDRSSLKPETLESIVRVKVNGPEDMNDFDGFFYTRKWLENHLRVDDGPSRQTKQAQVMTESELF